MAEIDTGLLAAWIGSLRQTVSGSLQQEMTDALHDAGPNIVRDMQTRPWTAIQRHAADSVSVSNDSRGISVKGGQGGHSLDKVLFAGGEYGGRKSRKVTYATRSPLGKAYIVRRRTTMQFLPHLGREGYVYWPTIREWMPKLAKTQEEIVEKVLG